MDYFEAVRRRRSVRKFTTAKVPREVIEKALEAAVLAPNSSNLQAWEFYWVNAPDKKAKLVEACLFQSIAKTSSHLVVAVARIDTWKKHRDLLMAEIRKQGPPPKQVASYYNQIIPFLYTHDSFGVLAWVKFIAFNLVGIFRPMFRRPAFRSDLFEVVTKSAALACENFMLAIVAQGYACCPMEGFDEARVKRLLGLSSKSHVVMIIGVGEADPTGIFGPQFRVDSKLVIHEV